MRPIEFLDDAIATCDRHIATLTAAAGRCKCRHQGEDWNETKKLHSAGRAKHGPTVRLLGAFRA